VPHSARPRVLNQQYVVEKTGIGVALILEGLILIGTGFVAERLRRTMAGRRTPPGGPALPLSGSEAPPHGSAPAETTVEPTLVEP